MVLMKSMKFPYRKAIGLIVLEMISASQRISGMKLIWKT
jgi:hypothetical protein